MSAVFLCQCYTALAVCEQHGWCGTSRRARAQLRMQAALQAPCACAGKPMHSTPAARPAGRVVCQRRVRLFQLTFEDVFGYLYVLLMSFYAMLLLHWQVLSTFATV